MKKKVHLLTIDAQRDFCSSGTGNLPKGALYVQGAQEDTDRLAKFIRKVGDQIYQIHATLDSHHPLHIAHGCMWVNSRGEHPKPITEGGPIITADAVRNGEWRATNPAHQAIFLDYVQQLEANKRYILAIWPEHCLIGSEGAALMPEVSDAFNDWARRRGRWVNFVPKGSRWDTEHYSAVKADVERPDDIGTKLNTDLINVIAGADEILISGEAFDYCVANTIMDIAAGFGDDNAKKFVLLTDTCSAVGAVPALSAMFEDFIKAKGIRKTTTIDWN